MNDFDKFESSIKDALDGFDEIKPSKTLKMRIELSLFFNKYINGIFITNIIAFMVLLSFSWLFSENLTKDETTNIHYSNINKTQNNYSATTKITKTENLTSLKPINKNTNKIKNNNTLEDKEENNNTNKTITSNTKEEQSSTNAASVGTNTDDVTVVNINKFQQNNKSNQGKTIVQSTITSPSTTLIVENNTTTSKSKLVDNKANKIVGGNEDSHQVYSSIANGNTEHQISIRPVTLINFIPHKTYSIEMPKIPNQLNFSKISKFNYEYEVYIGSTLNHSRFTFKDNVSSDENLTKTSNNPSLHLGGNIAAYYKSWFVRTGVNYNKTQDQLNYNNTSIQNDSITYFYTIYTNTYTDSIIGWNTNLPGLDSVPIIGISVQQTSSQHSYNEYFTTLKTRKLRYKNTNSYVNIPLMLGRKFTYRRIVFDVAGGVSWSHIIQSETQIIDAQTNDILKIENNSVNMNKDIINGALGIGFGYSINGFSQIFLRTQLEYNINDIFDKTYFKNHNAYRQRFSLGMRYNIK